MSKAITLRIRYHMKPGLAEAVKIYKATSRFPQISRIAQFTSTLYYRRGRYQLISLGDDLGRKNNQDAIQ